MYSYKILALPKVPEHFVKQAYDILEEESKNNISNWHDIPGYTEYRHREVRHLDGHVFKTAGTTRYTVSKEFEEWVEQHFMGYPITRYGISVMDVDHGRTLAPHVDTSRDYTIQYLLDLGGDEVDTVWWRERGKPVARPDLRQNYDPANTIQDYSNLDEIDRVRLEPGVWAILNASVLHSVENIVRPRIAFQVGLDVEPSKLPWTYASKINML